MREFTTNRKPVLFKIDEDTFMATPEIPAGVMLDLIKMQSELQSGEPHRQFDVVMQLFRELLVAEAYAKFERRLHDPENPIGMRTLIEVVQWLLGDAYGMRPTPSPSSSPGPSTATTGTSSTAGVPPAESTPGDSAGPDS
jgi:hypothetical protein